MPEKERSYDNWISTTGRVRCQSQASFMQRRFSSRQPPSSANPRYCREIWMRGEAEGNTRWRVEWRPVRTSSEGREWIQRTLQHGCTDPNQHITLLYNTCNTNTSHYCTIPAIRKCIKSARSWRCAPQPSTVRVMVKWVSAFGVSNNKWRWSM